MMDQEEYKIIQLMPIPDNIRPVTHCEDENGKMFYFDIIHSGHVAIIGLTDDVEEPIKIFEADNLGEFQATSVGYVPKKKCPCCGAEMWMMDNYTLLTDLKYKCDSCGKEA